MQKHGGGRAGKKKKKKRALSENGERERDVLMEFVKITMRGVSLKPAFISPLDPPNKVNTPMRLKKKIFKKIADLNSFPASRIRNRHGFSLLLSGLARWKANI